VDQSLSSQMFCARPARRRSRGVLALIVITSLHGGGSALAAPAAGREISSGTPPQSVDVQAKRPSRVDSARGAIEGRVLDQEGVPIAKVTVAVQRIGYGDGGRPILSAAGTATTDVTGAYRVGGLRRGQYYVGAVAPTPGAEARLDGATGSRERRSGFGPAFYPAAATVDGAMRVAVSVDETVSGIDIVLERRPLARVSGRVLGTRPLRDGAHVMLNVSSAFGRSAVVGYVGFTRPGAGGTFLFDNVPPGEYVLTARSVPASVLAEIANTGRSDPLMQAPDSEFGSLTLTVIADDVTELLVPLSEGGVITGRVVLQDEVVRPRGRPLLIDAQPAGADSLTGGSTQALLEHEGTFVLRGLSGPFVLRVSGALPAAFGRVEKDGLDVTDAGVLVGAGERVTGIEIKLESNPVEIVGHVADCLDESHCMLMVFAEDARRWSWPATRYVRAARVDAGVARIVGVPPGEYLAAVAIDVEDRQWRDPSYLKRLTGSATRLRIGDGERKSITFPSVRR
jgi:hypothetical protein